MKSKLLIFAVLFLFSFNLISALQLDISEVIVGEENVSFNISADDTLTNLTVNITGPESYFNSTNFSKIFLDNLVPGVYEISVFGNSTSGEDDFKEYFTIKRLVSLDSKEDFEDLFKYKFENLTTLSSFEVKLFNSANVLLGVNDSLIGSFNGLVSGNYIMQVNLTSGLGTNQIFNLSVSLPEFSSKVVKVKFSDDSLNFIADTNYLCENSSLKVYNSSGVEVYGENKNICGDYFTNLPNSKDYSFIYTATSKVYKTKRIQTEYFGVHPNSVSRTEDNISAKFNLKYANYTVYPNITISFYADGVFQSLAREVMGTILVNLDKEKDYTVKFLIGTLTGLEIEQGVLSKAIEKVDPVSSSSKRSSRGGGGINESCGNWSVCLNGTQTKICRDGEVIKSRNCEVKMPVIENNSTNETKDVENKKFYSPLTGAVIGAFTGENKVYWIVGFILVLLAVLWFVIKKKSNSTKKKVTKKTPKKSTKKTSKKSKKNLKKK